MRKKILIWSVIVIGSLALLLIVVYSVLNIVWSMELKNSIAAFEKSGKSLDIMSLVPKPVPDEQNAAVGLNKAFTLMTSSAPGKQYIANRQNGELNETIKFISEAMHTKGEWKPQEDKKGKLAELLNSREINEIIEVLQNAAEKPGYNFNLSYQDGFNMLLPHLQHLRTGVRLLCAKAIFEAEKGNYDAACKLLLASLRLSDYLVTEPTLVSYLAKIACFSITADTIDFIADKYGIPVSNALVIMHALEKTDFSEALHEAMDGEIVTGAGIFRKIIEGEMSSSEIELLDFSSCKKLYLSTPLLKKDFSVYLEIMFEFEKSIAMPYWETREKLKTIIPSKIPKYCIIAKTLCASFWAIKTKEAMAETKRSLCEINLALRIYKDKSGKYPDVLDALKPEILKEVPIDYLSGEALTYENEGGTFILKSESLEKQKRKNK